jgi:hypothetical protein
MAISDIIDFSGPYLGAFLYLIFLFIALNFQFYITYKLKVAGTKSKSIQNYRIIYLGVTIALAAYAIADMVGVLTEASYKINYTYFGIALSYTIVISGLNLFLLKTMNFRKLVRKIVKTLAIIETVLMITLVLLIIPSMFNEPIIKTMTIDQFKLIADLAIAVLGSVVIVTLIATVVSLFIESAKTVNKMIKLRLNMAAIGTLGFLLDGLANVLYIAVPGLDIPLYVNFIVPSLAAIFFTMMLVGFYFSLFPPIWLQRITNVLPPSFTDLMKKRSILKDSVVVSK